MLDDTTDTKNMNLSKLREMVKDRGAWRAAVHGLSELSVAGQLNNDNRKILIF